MSAKRQEAHTPIAAAAGPTVGGISVVTDPPIVRVAGDIDAATAAEFRAALEFCDDHPVIETLGLSEVGFFSAAGVRCFVELEWPTRPHPVIVGSAAVRRVLELCRLEFMLEPGRWMGAHDDAAAPPGRPR